MGQSAETVVTREQDTHLLEPGLHRASDLVVNRCRDTLYTSPPSQSSVKSTSVRGDPRRVRPQLSSHPKPHIRMDPRRNLPNSRLCCTMKTASVQEHFILRTINHLGCRRTDALDVVAQDLAAIMSAPACQKPSQRSDQAHTDDAWLRPCRPDDATGPSHGSVCPCPGRRKQWVAPLSTMVVVQSPWSCRTAPECGDE